MNERSLEQELALTPPSPPGEGENVTYALERSRH
jgi:hypothetical protein